MTESPFKNCENKDEGIPDIWECRYFVYDSKPPHVFEHDRLMDRKEFFDRWDGPRDDTDIYFISDNTGVNVKIRKSGESEPTIKLRVLRDTSDEFQLWHTEFVERLPAPATVWKEVLEQLHIEGNEKLLSNHSQPAQVEEALRAAKPELLCIKTQKHRWRYIGPLGEVEVARVTVFSSSLSSLYSIAFESKSADTTGIRTIRDKLARGVLDVLGTPKSYVELLRQLPK